MINNILNLILRFVFWLLGFIINIVLFVFPDFTIVGSIATIFDSFFGLFFDNCVGLLYFLVGPMLPTFVTTAFTLFTIRHIVLPVVNFLRKFIIK